MNSEKPPDKEQDNKPIVRVVVEKGESDQKEYFFKDTFRIGRDNSCAIKINDGAISRDHLEISYKKGEWWIADLFSSNGTYLDGKKVDHLILSKPIQLELGKNGPIISLELISGNVSRSLFKSGVDGSLTTYIQRYFNSKPNDLNIGKHTKMIQEAFKIIKKKQSKKYIMIISGVAIIAIIAIVNYVQQQKKFNQFRIIAENAFYTMKEFELKIDSLKLNQKDHKSLLADFENQKYNYIKLIDSLKLFSDDIEERLIQLTAIHFGEFQIDMPEEFLAEVKLYIKNWCKNDKSKLINSLQRARNKNYMPCIIKNLSEYDLPLQFFYLALQESEFIDTIVGPATYKGFAKGIWQFIPETAKNYNLQLGSMEKFRVYDPGDDRFKFDKATEAAAKYLNYIYHTEAKASGLLVLASYNWGEDRVNQYLTKLTPQPKERNYWKFLLKYRNIIPQQTYDYVFKIFSAAVIGENPRYFGFNFDNPLLNIDHKIN